MLQLLFIIFIVFKKFSFIKNKDLPICKNCIHFINYEKNPELNDVYGKCKLFGEKNIITGEITYTSASTSRDCEHLCGITAKYYDRDLM
jgi:hypothetical protein